MTSRWLDDVEDRAWRGYRRMFTMLEARLARELTEATGLSVAEYSVLSNLVEAEGRRWRLTDLARHMEWSQSRLSHQIARMEDRGLVRREKAETDGRGVDVILTRRGLETIASATPEHMEGVRSHFVEQLSHSDLGALGDIAWKIVDHLEREAPRRDAP